MKLFQIFLPLADNEGKRFSQILFTQVKDNLANKYQGVTAYTQSPAEGLWQEEGKIQKDQIVIYEVMAPNLDHQWWNQFKTSLEALFKQDEIMIRCLDSEML